ncbi:hypothetical protein MCAP1_000367 [Malassezia caprae]|uniref:GATA-type domain-containing protein n=1 Tax=Malassezia caprae TaxID=1381934 RepID=A0AAF0ITS9_9BASI|nr:hypothetical protein MCAP1_000367 [Malassezia caprae]
MAAEPTTRDAGATASTSPASAAQTPIEAPKIPAGGPWHAPTHAAPPAPPKAEASAPAPAAPVDSRPAAPAPVAAPTAPPAPVRKPSKPSSHANRAKNVALAALTGGSIGLPAQETPAPGFLPAGGGARKVIPELVLPFPLPCEEDVTEDADMELGSSVVCLQALRQTRMMHMLQILPPYSHRQRAGMEFYEVVPPQLLPGIQARAAHTLVSLGRADVQVGPMTYYGVRFWHLRPTTVPMARAPRPMRPPVAQAPGPVAQGAGPSVAPPGASAPNQAPQVPPQPQPQAPQPQAPPPQAPPPQAPPPLDAGFVARLQQRAERDPHLQHLLQLARAGQLPEQGMIQLNAILASLMTPPVPPPEERAPPVVLVEFPENPSVQLVLPLWHAAVERQHVDGKASCVLLSFFAPAIGSKAAGDSGKDEAQAAVDGMLVRDMSHVQSAPPPDAPPIKEEAAPTEPPEPEPKRRRPGTRGKSAKADKPGTKAPPPPPPRNHELFPLTWRITSDYSIDERLWDCLGRVPGCLTNGAWASPGDERVFAAIKASFAQRKRTMPALHRLPPRLKATDIPPGLVDHVQDRYAMRMAVYTHRPQPKRKVAMLSDTKEASHARSMEPTPRAPLVGEDGAKPKRKRHVATHNPDGSIKSCGACGKTKTPMWRRGPKGPSQLCNACGAKWKAGRLIVPDVPPPPILNDVLPVRHVKPPMPSIPPSGAPGVHGPPMMPVPQVPPSTSAPFLPPVRAAQASDGAPRPPAPAQPATPVAALDAQPAPAAASAPPEAPPAPPPAPSQIP